MNAVIAGGFALACITGELYDTSDIDIYIPSTTIQNFQSKLRKTKFEQYLLKNGYEKTSFYDINSQVLYENFYYEFQHKDSKKRLQIICHSYDKNINSLSVGKSVIYDFDFTTVMCFIQQCKNGKKRPHFNHHHLNDVANKTIKLNQWCPNLNTEKDSFILKRFHRLLKYKSRGYKLSESMNTLLPGITHDFIKYEESINENETV
jgi:hypothetical protein